MALKSLGAAASSSNELVTKGYVDGLSFGGGTPTSFIEAVQCTTKGGETYTISSGHVTEIAGTTHNDVAMAVGMRILIQGAPASSGAGNDWWTTGNPANGIYEVTGLSGGNTQVARSADMSGSVNPLGLTTYIIRGEWIPKSFITVSWTSDFNDFTYGTDVMTWEGTGGRNLNINSAFFAAESQTIGISNGTGATYIQPTEDSGNNTVKLPPDAGTTTIATREYVDQNSINSVDGGAADSNYGGSLVAIDGGAS